MPDSNSADLTALVSRNAAGEALSKALRLVVGRGKRWSVKEVESGAGVPARMIESYLCHPDQADWRPAKLAEALSLARFLGPEFTSEWLVLAEQAAFWLPEPEDTPPGEMAADNADDSATLTRAALDGVFDRCERPGLKVVGKRMMARGATLARLAA